MYSINRKFNKIFNAIGYKTRTDILEEISKSETLTLYKLAKKFSMSKQTLKFHIQKLKDAKIITSKRKDNSILLILNRSEIHNAINTLQNVLKE